MKAWHALILFAGVALGLMLAPRASVPARATDHDAEDMTSRETDVAASAHAASPKQDLATNAALAKILERLDRLEAQRDESGAARAATAHREADRPEASLLDGAVSRRLHTAMFERALAAEPRDSAWARQTETEINEVLRSDELAAGNKVTRMECKKTLCKLEIEHATQAAADLLPMSLPMSLTSMGSAWYVQNDEHGQLSSLFYFARKGTQLPQMPREELAAAAQP